MFERLLKKKPTAPDAGDRAPNFTLPALEGGEYTLAQAVERAPQVIAFFKISCSTCQFTFPFLERLHRAYETDPVEFRGVSQDNAENSRLFCEKFGVTFPIAIDAPSYAASKSYVFHSVPTILLVDRERAIRFRLTGFSKSGLIRLSEEIAHLTNRPPAPVFLPSELVPETKPG
jgi:peroxiredoxin